MKEMSAYYLLGSWKEDITTICLCFIWYLSSALKNSFAKEFLLTAPLPVTSSFLECFFTVICTMGTLYFQNKQKDEKQKESFEKMDKWAMVGVVMPICLASVIGHTLTQISLEYIQVSFTHTIKSLAPVFTMFLAYFFLGDTFSVHMILSVIPIVLGVLLSSSVEITFNIIGCATALLSCFIFCSQNVYLKTVVDKKQMDAFDLLLYSNMGASLLLFLLAFATEWTSIADFTDAHLVVLNTRAILLVVGVGFFHFLQSISAVFFLVWVSSVSYSIANTFKRVFVIMLSIIYFGNEVTFLNYMGIFVSVTGILLYSKANDVHKASISKITTETEADNKNCV